MTTIANKWITAIAIGGAILFVVGFLVSRIFLFDYHRVPSAAMYPTIPEGSFIIVDKRGYGHYSLYGIDFLRGPMTAVIARGDIVVHQIPKSGGTLYVKRIIGMPGDKIDYVDNRLTINGTPINYTNNLSDGKMTFATENVDGVGIPIAWDSTRLATDYSTVVPVGQYFVFGDNRNNSRDSRFIGPIPKDFVAGKVVKVFPPTK